MCIERGGPDSPGDLDEPSRALSASLSVCGSVPMVEIEDLTTGVYLARFAALDSPNIALMSCTQPRSIGRRMATLIPQLAQRTRVLACGSSAVCHSRRLQ